MRNVKDLLSLTLISVYLSILFTCTPETPDFDSYKAPKLDAAGKIFLPQDTTLFMGEKYPMYVKIKSGNEPFTYRWYRNGTCIDSLSGITLNQTLSIVSAGAYRVYVSNSFGKDSSTLYTIKDTALYSAKLLNGGKIKRIGTPAQDSNLTFFVQGRGRALLEYHWYKKRSGRGSDSLLTGNTDSTLAFTPVRYADNGYYYVVCTNPYGSQTSLVDSIPITDTIKPSIHLLLPKNNIIVSDSIIPVRVAVYDKSGVRLVAIKGDSVFSTDSIYTKNVKLSNGKNEFYIKAVDRSVTVNRDSLLVTLTYDPAADDNTPPVIELISPQNNSVFSDSMVSVKLKIKDRSGISFVTVNKEPVTSTDSLYLKRVVLNKGSNAISIVVSDNSKNKNTDSTVVTFVYDPNTEDNQGPFIDLITPVNNSVFETDSTVQIKLTITDRSGVGLVTINNEAITSTDSDYMKLLTLKTGVNKFLIKAIDKSAKMNRDSLLVTLTYSPSFTVTYKGNDNSGGTVPVDANKYKKGTMVTVLTQGTLVKSGYTFIGWNTKADGAGTSHPAGSTFAMVPENVILYAQWTTAPTYTVTFDGQGATVQANPTSIIVIPPATTVGTLPTAPVKTGYTFGGWYTTINGGGTEFTASTVVTVSITVYAKWSTAPIYTVTFDGQDATVQPNPANMTVTSPATTVGTLPTAPGKTGYFFSGWYTAINGGGTEFTASTVVTTNITVYAKWTTVPTYIVTFDGQSATVQADPANITVTSPATTVGTLPIAPAKTGYIFGGWYTAINGGGTAFTASTVVTTNITVYAKWNSYTYTVTFDDQSATVPVNPTSKTVASPATTVGTLPTAPTKTGYTFGGWYSETGGSGTVFTAITAVTASITVFAKWTANTYTVTFDAQGGTTPVPGSMNVTYGSAYGTLATTTRTGYTFGGWWTESGGAGTQITSGTTVATSSNHTLYAKWTANTYAVTFDAQSGTTPVPGSMNVTYGSAYGTLATTTRTGYTFAGWWTVSGGTGTQITSGTTVTTASNHTLYANWTVNKYTLTLSMGGTGGLNVTGAGEVTHGVANPISATAIAGYDFDKWTVTSGAGVTISDPNSAATTVTLTAGNANVRADFKIKTYIVTFNSMGGSAVPSQTINHGASATEPNPAPTKTAYTCVGWYTEETFINKWVFTTAITSTRTLYAKWVVMDADGNIYTTVTINNQTWLVENLKVTRLNDSTPIPMVTDDLSWSALTTPGYCWYDNDPTSYKNSYGALYNWYAVDTKKLAIKGWHVPTEVEFKALETFLGGENNAGGKLKEIGFAHWDDTVGATNETGFTAVGGGERYSVDGTYHNIKRRGDYWSATEGYFRYFRSSTPNFTYETTNLNFGNSVRLLKD
jgi:uncharacterized protein (TIGR02145 family)/uncharacterized repeat protein (TIGR02543 family)